MSKREIYLQNTSALQSYFSCLCSGESFLELLDVKDAFLT